MNITRSTVLELTFFIFCYQLKVKEMTEQQLQENLDNIRTQRSEMGFRKPSCRIKSHHKSDIVQAVVHAAVVGHVSDIVQAVVHFAVVSK